MPSVAVGKAAERSRSQQAWRILFMLVGLVPAVILGKIGGGLFGYAFFNDERAWSYAVPLFVGAVVLLVANIAVVVRLEGGAGLASGLARALRPVSLAGGLLGVLGGGVVFRSLNAAGPENFWLAAGLLGLHFCAASIPIVSGWGVLRG